MANIFINGLNAKVGGGKSILNNYLGLLKKDKNKIHTYFVLTPNAKDYRQYDTNNINIIRISRLYNSPFLFPFVYGYLFSFLFKKLNIDTCFNLADIPIVAKVPQVFLFDWPYAVYLESIVWKKMDRKSWLFRKLKLFYFKRNLKYISNCIAQTNTVKKRLEAIYKFEKVEIIPNAVSLENMEVKKHVNFSLPEAIKLLYLTHYYPHKNIEIFLPLAQEIKKRNLNYKIILTIEENQHPKAKIFLECIKFNNLEDIIINIGAVDMDRVPSLYQQCDGLLMPTLLESFSGTYVEAMFHKIPIFTSDIDFARDVCQKAAFYFDPLDSNSILSKINKAFKKEELRREHINKGSERINDLQNWEQTYKRYNHLIEKSLFSEN